MFEVCAMPWKYRTEPFRIADRLYYIGNAYVSSYLLDTGDGLAIIDTAFPQTAYLLIDSIVALGFSPKRIKHILHTHCHYDHFGATRALKELTGARTYMGAGDGDMFSRTPELTWAEEYGVELFEQFDMDILVNDGDKINIGEFEIDCVSTPGHTDGTISYFFKVTENGREYRAGMHGGPGLNTLSEEYLISRNLPFSRRQRYIESLERLSCEKVDITLGIHPEQADILGKFKRAGGANPFIDPGEWNLLLSRLKADAVQLFGRELGSK